MHSVNSYPRPSALEPSAVQPIATADSTLAGRLNFLDSMGFRRIIAMHMRWYAVAVLLCMAAFTAFAWPVVTTHLQALAVLDQVANKPIAAPIRWLIAEPVATSELTLELPSGTIRARLYTPRYHPHAPAVLILHGVHYLGIDEPRLVAFASAISSCGLRVLTPELPDIKDYHIGANSIASIGEASGWLAHQNGGQPVGVIGLSFSGSLSLLAAGRPRFSPSIKFVFAIGSEDQMSRVANYYITGEDIRPDGTEEMLPPHEYGALVLEYAHLEELIPRSDLAAVRTGLRDHLYEDVPAERAALATLTSSQAAEAKQLMDTTSPITRRRLAEIDAVEAASMDAVSPHSHLAQLRTPVYLLHGEGDNIIPAAETEWLEADVPRNALQAALISPVLSHLDLDGEGPSVADQLRLVHLFALVLHASQAPS